MRLRVLIYAPYFIISTHFGCNIFIIHIYLYSFSFRSLSLSFNFVGMQRTCEKNRESTNSLVIFNIYTYIRRLSHDKYGH